MEILSLGVIVGLVVCLVMIHRLRERVGALESALDMQRTEPSPIRIPQPGAVPDPDAAAARAAGVAAGLAARPANASAGERPARAALDPSVPFAMPSSEDASQPQIPASAQEPSSGTTRPSAPPPLPPRPQAPAMPPRPNVVEVGLRTVKRWFTTGNVPVKIGMLVLLAGVAALLKYAGDQGWLRVPMELRLAGVAASALAALVFAWRKRESNRSFSLAVQGGAIGVLLLTVFAAYKMYTMINAPAAFGLSVVLIAGMGVLAVLQDSRTLAVLGVLAGFLAPIWLSDGSGNHVALFSYYALLNAAIFAIAWKRSWRILNLLGFVFTWGIGITWGVLDYDASKYQSTQPFLLLFFAFYLALPILYARRRPARSRDRIDGCLLFGTPLIAFSLQAVLLEQARMPLAFCALGLAAIYALLARALIHRERYAVLGQAHAMLAVGFATLAVPLALSARVTASVFALEGAGLVWLGLRQGRRTPQISGLVLQLLAALALGIGLDMAPTDTVAVANATFMGALLITLASFATAWVYRSKAASDLAIVAYLWGMVWWLGNAVHELQRFLPWNVQADAWLAFAALTGWIAAEVHRRKPAPALVITTLVGFAVAIPLAIAQSLLHDQPLAGHGALAWLVFAVLGIRALLCVRTVAEDRFAPWAQFIWWLVWPTMLSLAGVWLGEHFKLADGWRLALLVLPWLALMLIAQTQWRWLSLPLGERFDRLRGVLQGVLIVMLMLYCFTGLFFAGYTAPLPWAPLLNPLDLSQIAVLILLARWLVSAHAPSGLHAMRLSLLGGAAFALITCFTLRVVHHWGGVPWNDSLVSTMLAQTSLTLVWSVLGVAGWVLGSRRGQRMLWLAGAVLMAVVLVKLVLVDRRHLGNLLGIGSFIGYGLLCTLVGYLAPAPPRRDTEVPEVPEEAREATP